MFNPTETESPIEVARQPETHWKSVKNGLFYIYIAFRRRMRRGRKRRQIYIQLSAEGERGFGSWFLMILTFKSQDQTCLTYDFLPNFRHEHPKIKPLKPIRGIDIMFVCNNCQGFHCWKSLRVPSLKPLVFRCKHRHSNKVNGISSFSSVWRRYQKSFRWGRVGQNSQT